MRATGPYFVRDRTAYCARCRRTRLAKIKGTNYLGCPRCDIGSTIAAGMVKVDVIAGVMVCARCGVNELIATPNGREFECPRCDTPEWEQEKAGRAEVEQLSLMGNGNPLAGLDTAELPERGKRPESQVHTCIECGRKCDQVYAWTDSGWRPICSSCGNWWSRSQTRKWLARRKLRSKG